MLESSVFDWNDAAVRSTQTGSVRQFFQSPTAMLEQLKCHTTTLNAGQAPHSSHAHPEEELIVVTEGELTAVVDGEERKASPGSMIFFGSGQEHGLKNSSSVRAVYSVIRWRARTT